VLTLAACAFWLASKLAKILAGTFRRGSGITGSGGVAVVAPVVIGAFCCSDALI
jgi:amino acid transporter